MRSIGTIFSSRDEWVLPAYVHQYHLEQPSHTLSSTRIAYQKTH